VNPKVIRSFNRLQRDLLELLSELDNINPELLQKHPAPGKWSVVQVMHHLNAAESLSALYVSKKRLAAPQLKRTGIEAALRLLFARISFYIPLKYKAPKLLGTVPENISYSEIKNSWLKTREQLSKLLDSLSEDELYKPIFRQPTFGRWNIFQMLGFMQTHFNRHKRQIKKALKSLR
jgi:hypothetical protein